MLIERRATPRQNNTPAFELRLLGVRILAAAVYTGRAAATGYTRSLLCVWVGSRSFRVTLPSGVGAARPSW